MDFSKRFKIFLFLILFLFIILISSDCHAFTFTYNGHDYTLSKMGNNQNFKTYTFLWGGFYHPNSTETEFYLYSSDSPLYFKRNSAGDVYVMRDGSSTIYYNPVRISSTYNTVYNTTSSQSASSYVLSRITYGQNITNTQLQQYLVYCDDFTLVVREADNVTEQVIYAPYPTYDEFPYFLNSEEDIQNGYGDIIIMPRRFY